MSRYTEEEEKFRKYHKMTLEQLQAELARETREAVIRELESVGGTVENIVRGAAMQMMQGITGFKKDSWGRWEYEGGERTEVAKRIHQSVEATVEKYLLPTVETFVTELPKAAIRAAQKKYEEEFNYRFQQRLSQIAEERAEAAANALADKLYPRKASDE